MAGSYRDALTQNKYSSESIRNVCILAHVDHGKTTVADQLLTINMIITKRLAGTVKLLDDREDEQTRGITMKSSPVSLIWERPENAASAILVNFIDTPGHVDFSTEVAAAVRLCDGAFIVVDVIEGVCVQTKEAIKQAFEEGVKMILLLNKFDKLIVELSKDVSDIFNFVLRVIEDCNAYIADLIRVECAASGEEIDDEKYFFSPVTGNVIFCSALHGWGFTLRDIAKLFVDKIEGENEDSLTEKMWDFDNYIDGKTKLVKKGAILKAKENLFVQMCLKTLHYIYTIIVTRMDSSKINDIALKLQIKITQNMRHPDPRSQIKTIMQAWNPLSHAMLTQCDKSIPSPKKVSDRKIKYLTNFTHYLDQYRQKLYECLISCSIADEAPVVAYISKMLCVDRRIISNIPGKNDNEQDDDNNLLKTRNLALVALTRIFSGTIKVGQEIYFLSPNYNPEYFKDATDKNTFLANNSYVRKVIIKELFVLYGRDFVYAETVKAGNICGIGGLQEVGFRKGTLTTNLEHVPLIEREILEPIVRTTIEPAHVADYPMLRAALRLVMQTDSCIQVKMQETGDLVLLTAGDVHLAKCMEDLKKFTDVEVKLSEPMVSLRETVSGEEHNVFSANFAQPKIFLSIEVLPLPKNIAGAIKTHYDLLQMIENHQCISGIDVVLKRKQSEGKRCAATLKTLNKEQTQNAVKNVQETLQPMQYIWSVGLYKENTNILCGEIASYKHSLFYTLDEEDARSCFVPYIINAFKNFCKAGPVCGEPLMNCTFVVREFTVSEFDDELDPHVTVNFEGFVKNTMQEAFLRNGPRLMEPIFTTDIEVNTKILGK